VIPSYSITFVAARHTVAQTTMSAQRSSCDLWNSTNCMHVYYKKNEISNCWHINQLQTIYDNGRVQNTILKTFTLANDPGGHGKVYYWTCGVYQQYGNHRSNLPHFYSTTWKRCFISSKRLHEEDQHLSTNFRFNSHTHTHTKQRCFYRTLFRPIIPYISRPYVC
jgi:hypothetical protein